MGIVVIVVVLLAVLAWFFWPSKSVAGVARKERPDVDEIELERAERDVQEAADDESVRDWGPGTGQKPLP
jgi:beta-lactam-binding protein with PASTA domain